MKSKKINAPEWLDENGRKLFAKLEKYHAEQMESVLMICQSWQTYRLACNELNEYGLTMTSNNGYVRKNPAFDIAKYSLENFVKLAKCLGLFEEHHEQIKDEYDKFKRW